MESSHFLAVSSPCPLYKMLFFDFSFRPPNAQNLLPKICKKKSPTSRLVWQIDRRCLHIPGVSTGMADSMEPCKMLWGRPLLPWQRNLARRGDLVAYRLVSYVCYSAYFTHCTGKDVSHQEHIISATVCCIVIHCASDACDL